MRCKVAAVDADAADRDAFTRKLRRQLDDACDRPLGVVGVDQQGRPLRPGAGERHEGIGFAGVRLHVRMGHGAEHRDVEAPAGFGGGRAIETGQVGRPRRQQRGVGTMGPSHTEVHQPPAPRRKHHARSLRGDEGLEVHDVQQAALHQLRLRQRRGDAQDGLVGEEHAALGHRMHVAGESERAQPIQQLPREARLTFEPCELVVVERERLQKGQRLLETRGHEEVAARWQPAHEEFEGRALLHALFQVRLEHGQLVQVGQQGAHETFA